jgi:hypothetical protein
MLALEEQRSQGTGALIGLTSSALRSRLAPPPPPEPALGPKLALLLVPGCFDGAVNRGLTVFQDLVDRHLAG